MPTIIIKRPTKPISKADARAPAGDCAKSTVVCYEVTDIDALALRRKLLDLVFPSAMSHDDRLSQIRQIAGLVAANIKCQTLSFPSNRGIEKRFGRIVDVKQIPALLATPDLEGLSLDHPAQPDT